MTFSRNVLRCLAVRTITLIGLPYSKYRYPLSYHLGNRTYSYMVYIAVERASSPLYSLGLMHFGNLVFTG